MQNCVYYFYINGTKVNPVYKNDLAKEISAETGQQFLREKLTSKLTLYEEGFNLINNANIESQFNVIVQKEILGKFPTPYFKGRFFKTDCAFNFDDRSVEFSVDPSDEYNQILEVLDKEIDIVQLAPKITPLKAWKRPVIQVYVPGSNKVDNFLSGNQWQQDVTERITDVNKLVRDLYFSQVSSLRNIVVTANSNASSPDAAGTYVGDYKEDGSGIYYKVGDNNHRMVSKIIPNSMSYKRLTIQKRLNNTSNTWEDLYASAGAAQDPYDLKGYNLSSVGTQTGTLSVPSTSKSYIFMRLMCDVDKIDQLNTYPIPTNDIVVNNLNYRRVIGYKSEDTALISSNISDTPTQWGLTSGGKYYAPPYHMFAKLYPISRDTWAGYSLWFNFSYLDFIVEKSARKDFNIPSAYFLSDVLQVVLKKLGVDAKFEPSTRSSQFFYSDNMVNDYKVRLMITPKSNILHGEEAVPATSAPTTLGALFKMLKDVMQVYWFVEDGFLRLEHIEYFRNGGSYNSNRTIQIDATKLINSKTKRELTYGTNKIEFEKEDMPEQFQFEYMDDSSAVFKGLPLVMKSKLVNLGKVENIAVSGFSADIDYMMADIENTSQSGFALFGVENTFKSDTPIINKNTYILPSNSEITTIQEATLPKVGWETVVVDNKAVILNFELIGWGTEVRISTVYGDNLASTQTGVVDKQGFLSIPLHLIPWGKRYITFKTTESAPNQVTADSKIGVMRYIYAAPLVGQKSAELPFIPLRLEEEGVPPVQFNAQNGYLAWPYLAQNYYNFNLPSRNAYMGETRIRVRGTVKNRKQTIDIPLEEDPTDVGLIRTGYGDGMLDKANINLSSRQARLTLKYDLYENNF